jgi:hypothetical protein
MIIYEFEKAKEELEKLLETEKYMSVIQEIHKALSVINKCTEAFNAKDDAEAKRLMDETLKYYQVELLWLTNYEKPYISTVLQGQLTFWDRFVFLTNSIPFYALLKIGRSELVKKLILIS